MRCGVDCSLSWCSMIDDWGRNEARVECVLDGIDDNNE